MRDHTLNPDAWVPWFRVKAPFLQGARVTLEVLDPAAKRVRLAEKARIDDLSYDPDSQAVVVTGPELEHTIAAPSEIRVLIDAAQVPTALEVTDGTGIRHILHIQAPRALM